MATEVRFLTHEQVRGAGDVSAVVHVYPDRRAYEVEFLALDGEALAVVTLPSSNVRRVQPREVTHARSLAAV